MSFNLKKSAAIAICLSTISWTSSARADGWPTSVAGTWSVEANQSVGTLIINQPSSSLRCRPITGTIFTSSLQGFYCPFSGNIDFTVVDNNGITFQYYKANLSVNGGVLRMGGSFSSLNNSFGNYSFSAKK